MTDDVVSQELERLKDKEDVRAIAVVGSYARKPEDEHNDIDFYIIIDGEWRERETVEKEDVIIERFYNSQSRSKRYLEEEGWYTNYHWFTNADVRYDPENLFDELEEYARQKKQDKLELDEKDRERIRYRIWDLKQDIGSDDVGQQRYILYNAMDFVIEKIYYLEDEVPVKENYRIRKLKDFNGYLYKIVQDFLNSSSTLEKKRKVEKMLQYLERKVGEADPEFSHREEL